MTASLLTGQVVSRNESSMATFNPLFQTSSRLVELIELVPNWIAPCFISGRDEEAILYWIFRWVGLPVRLPVAADDGLGRTPPGSRHVPCRDLYFGSRKTGDDVEQL